MNLKELKSSVDMLCDSAAMMYMSPEEITVGIIVKTANAVGGTPIVSLKGLRLGFDWDKGKCLIHPLSDLREISRDELAALRKNNVK